METAKKLRRHGYRVTSRKYCMASRVDRADWRDRVAYIWDDAQAADQYRRVHSKDRITIPQAYIKEIGSSCGSRIGYVDKDA